MACTMEINESKQTSNRKSLKQIIDCIFS